MGRKLKYLMIFITILALSVVLIPSSLGADSTAQVRAFVTGFYVNCLGRSPDAQGLEMCIRDRVSMHDKEKLITLFNNCKNF